MGLRRRVFRAVLVATVFAVATLLSAPWWIPALLTRTGRHFGATVESWEKESLLVANYRGLRYEFPGGTVEIGSVRAPVLGVWPRAEGGGATVAAEKIRVKLEPVTPEADAPRDEASVHQILNTVMQVWPELESWLPDVRVDDVTVETGGTVVRLSSVKWIAGGLAVAGRVPVVEEPFELTLRRSGGGDLVMGGRVQPRDVSWRLEAGADAATANAQATVEWRGNTARVEATFGSTGLLPSAARVTAESLQVPAELAGLSGYGPIGGDVRLSWDGSRYSGVIRASAEPAAASSTLPPLEVDLRAVGDLDRLRAESVDIRIPGIRAALATPLEWEFAAGVPVAPARFDLAVDVAALPWVEGEGQVRGAVDASRSSDGQPLLEFELAGANVAWRKLAGAGFTVQGALRGLHLAIDQLEANVGEGSRLSAHGAMDFSSQKLQDVELTLRLDHAGLSAWAPDAPEFASMDVHATIEGPASAPGYASTLTIAGLKGVPGGDLDARLSLKGTGIDSAALEGVVESAAGVELPIRADLARSSDGRLEVALDHLAWNDAQGLWWSLAEPTRVEITPAAAAEGAPPTIELDETRLRGESIALQVKGMLEWPAQGRFEVSNSKFATARLAGLLPEAYLGIDVESLDLAGNWANGPATLSGHTRASYTVGEHGTYSVEAGLRTAGDSRSLDAELSFFAESGVVLEGQGQLPLELAGTADGFVMRLLDDAPLGLKLTSQPNPAFWRSMAELTRWTVTDPALNASIEGTLKEPRGEIRFATRELVPARSNGEASPWPRLGDLSLVLAADSDGTYLVNTTMAVEDSWIRMDGQAPWEFWRTLWDEKQVAWRECSFSLASSPIPVAIASRAFPNVLAPGGSVSFDVRHKPVQGLTGQVWLHGASLRPVAPFGSVREINAELDFDEYRVTLPALTALVGGRSVELSGRGSLAPGAQPEFSLRAYSEGVPLVRESGLVVRAAVDVEVTSKGDAPAEITGEVNLGPSVFVADLGSLMPKGGVTTPEERPPYFSVKDEPFSKWKLDVDVKGDEFLRVESPLFQGLLSADFNLEGTLGEPKAIGRVTSRKGTIVFPFATLQLQNLEVSLSEDNPYEPRVLANAGTRVFGYDVRMDVSGSASEPRLSFSADPPLASQKVFLMISTGQLPDSEYAFSTSERAQRLAFFLGKKLASDYGIGGSGGGGESRLTVRSGENFSREGRETTYVQYDLDRRWSLVGEYDRFDAYNGGIKFRLVNR